MERNKDQVIFVELISKIIYCLNVIVITEINVYNSLLYFSPAIKEQFIFKCSRFSSACATQVTVCLADDTT